MKQRGLRKLVSMILAVVMMLSMSATAFAADNTVSVANTTDHTYTAYRIFTGTQQDSTGTALGNIEWDVNFDSTDFLAALIKSTTIGSYFESCESAADVAAVLVAQKDNTTLLNAFAALAYSYVDEDDGSVITSGTTQLEVGYYLSIDTTEELEEGDTYSRAILLVTGTNALTIQDKRTNAPKVEKKVEGEDAISAAVGDTLNYTLTGTVPDMSDYSTYYYQFVDTLTEGLSYNNDAEVYVVDSANGETEITENDNVSVSYNENTMTLTVTITNLTQYNKYVSVVVKYTADLNEKAVIGGEGNPNTVKLVYSNDPNSAGRGETVEDKVTVVTFALKVDKTDGTSALQGAGFTLYKEEEIEAFVSGVTYYTVAKDKIAEVKSDATIDEDETYYIKIEEIKEGTETSFTFSGLDVGSYVLVESATPAGYNTADPIYFSIAATCGENGVINLTVESESNLSANSSTGIISTTVVNNKGSLLPSTGGIGTTVFYIVGGILVLGAAVLFVTKKRLSSEN